MQDKFYNCLVLLFTLFLTNLTNSKNIEKNSLKKSAKTITLIQQNSTIKRNITKSEFFKVI